MPFCTKCGAEVPENVKFCTKCGNSLQAGQSTSSSAPQAGQAEKLSLWEYYIKVLKNYADFKGRARRKEYWGFYLFNMIIAFAVSFLGGFISGIFGDKEGTLGVVLYCLYGLAVFIPSLAVLVRRLHDIGKSGWNWLWVFTIIGIVPVLIWLCTDSYPVENEYGPDPKAL